MSVHLKAMIRLRPALALLLFLAIGCSPTATPQPNTPAATLTSTPVPATATPAASPTLTPTPTMAVPIGPTATPTAEPSACRDLAGNLEVAVLVGPADAVGLTPDAVGQIPFAVDGNGAPYAISGAGPISYEDMLIKEWGSYAVTLNMQATIAGACSGPAGAEQLHLDVELTGDQLVIVTSEGFSAEYPWSGTHEFGLDFPLMDGATVQGKGWAFTLHLTGA